MASSAIPSDEACSSHSPPSEKDDAKGRQVLAACHDRDLRALNELACSEGGFVEDRIRCTAWPTLLGCDKKNNQPLLTYGNWSTLPRHRDEDQVQLDVDRSFVYYPDNESETRRDARKDELSNVITTVLRHHPILCYFQGYHDIVQVFLLVLGAADAAPAVARLSLLRIRDFMLPTIAASESHLRLLPAILYAADVELYNHLSGATKPTPFFALAATLTLYAHDIEEYGDIARLFDYLLASEAALPVYLFAVIVISRKRELLEIEPDEPEMLHSVLSKLPKPLNLESLITKTQALFRKWPPQRLPNRAWSRISSNSVLKTTREPIALAEQTLGYGTELFHKQATEIQRQESLKKIFQQTQALAYRYQRPVRWTGTAVLVAALALYFGRSSVPVLVAEHASFALVIRQKVVDLVQRWLA